jgi:hypothetical protein
MRRFTLLIMLLGCSRDAGLNVPIHLKNGETRTLAGVTFTVMMLPKLLVSGPQPEIEQAQITCGKDVVQVDTVHKIANCGGLSFELGYADVYHDDIELTVRR